MFLGKYRRKRMTRAEANAVIEKAKYEAPLELEKGDIPAMILAALIVFVPFILVIAGTLGLIWFLIFVVIGG